MEAVAVWREFSGVSVFLSSLPAEAVTAFAWYCLFRDVYIVQGAED